MYHPPSCKEAGKISITGLQSDGQMLVNRKSRSPEPISEDGGVLVSLRSLLKRLETNETSVVVIVVIVVRI